MEEEKKNPEEVIIINEEIDKKLRDLEKIMKEIQLPVKANIDYINQTLYAPISDEAKIKVIDEIYEDTKKRVEGYVI